MSGVSSAKRLSVTPYGNSHTSQELAMNKTVVLIAGALIETAKEKING